MQFTDSYRFLPSPFSSLIVHHKFNSRNSQVYSKQSRDAFVFLFFLIVLGCLHCNDVPGLRSFIMVIQLIAIPHQVDCTGQMCNNVELLGNYLPCILLLMPWLETLSLGIGIGIGCETPNIVQCTSLKEKRVLK